MKTRPEVEAIMADSLAEVLYPEYCRETIAELVTEMLKALEANQLEITNKVPTENI